MGRNVLHMGGGVVLYYKDIVYYNSGGGGFKSWEGCCINVWKGVIL